MGINPYFEKGGIAEAVTVTVASLLSEAGTTLASGIGIVWNIITANPILTLFVGASVVSLGFAFFKKAKSAAK